MFESSLKWETLAPQDLEKVLPEDLILRQQVSRDDTLQRFLWSAGAANETVLLLVNDPHRSTRTRAALSALGEAVRGLSRRPRFRALVATGTHRFDAREQAALETATFLDCGLDIDAVAWHDALDANTLAKIAGYRMHHWIDDAEFLLPIGSVEPHYFAGLTGAHKTLTIGCTSHEDIERNHARALDPASDVLRLKGNPVFDGIADMVRALESVGKRICVVNEIVRGDSVIKACAGDWFDSLERLAGFVHGLFSMGISNPADVLHLKVPPPLGRNFYQADKALKNNHLAVRDGGGIILDAECPEGIGPDAFMNLLREAPDYASARRVVRQRGYRLGDHKAVKLRHLTDPAVRDVRIALVSKHVSQPDAEIADMRVFANVDAATAWLTHGAVKGPLRRGLRIDDAGNFTARLRDQEPIPFPDTD